MAINNHLPWVLSSFNKQAQIAEGQTQQHVIEVNYYSLPRRSSCKLVSRYLLKCSVLPAPSSAVRNQLADCDWKAENLRDLFSSSHSSVENKSSDSNKADRVIERKGLRRSLC